MKTSSAYYVATAHRNIFNQLAVQEITIDSISHEHRPPFLRIVQISGQSFWRWRRRHFPGLNLSKVVIVFVVEPVAEAIGVESPRR